MLLPTSSNSTHILANLIISQYFISYRCLLLFTDDKDRNTNYALDIPSVKVFIDESGCVDFDLVFNSFGCQGFVIQSRNQVAVVRELERQIRHRSERFNQRRYLLINAEDVGVFEMEELNFIADFLVIAREAEKDERFVFKTHKYVGIAGNNEAVVLDKWFSWNQSFLTGANLYPDKLGNQQGRELRMATITYKPFSIVENDTDDYHGTELYSMAEYAKKHNMTSVLVVNELDYWGEIYPNRTGIGLMGNLICDRADIGFAAMSPWEPYYHYLDFSKPIIRSGVAFLVPAPGLASGWFIPLRSYTGHLWIGMAVVYLLGVSVFAVIKFCYHYNIVDKNQIMRKRLMEINCYNRGYNSNSLRDKLTAALKVFGEALFTISKFFMTQPLTPKEVVSMEFVANILVLVMLIFSFFFTASYSSGLATIMTVPRYEHAIDTMEDLVESGLHWGAPHDAWIESIKNATDYISVMMVSRFEVLSEENLRRYSIEGQFSFSIERLPFGSFAIGPYIKQDIIENYRLVQEDLFWDRTVIHLRKNSILLPSLNDFIGRVLESGIISRIQNEATYLFMDSTVQKAVRNSRHGTDTKVVTKLKLVHVQGALAILILGTAVSVVVFIFEHLMYKRNMKQNHVSKQLRSSMSKQLRSSMDNENLSLTLSTEMDFSTTAAGREWLHQDRTWNAIGIGTHNFIMGQLRWDCHVQRKRTEKSEQVLKWNIPNGRRKGRLRRRWTESIGIGSEMLDRDLPEELSRNMEERRLDSQKRRGSL